jgi:hypothetical protein
MAHPAYISLNTDAEWTVFAGDGSEETLMPLAIGQLFEPGEAILDAVAELQAWADENGYDLVTPHYHLHDIALQDLIEPDIYNQIFTPED